MEENSHLRQSRKVRNVRDSELTTDGVWFEVLEIDEKSFPLYLLHPF